MNHLLWAEGILLLLVLVGMPIYSKSAGRAMPEKQADLKGLNLPEGSIRGMLALMIIGSFIIFLVLGPGTEGMSDHFDKILVAFGTLTGAVIGFYFGNRGTTGASPGSHPSNAQPKPDDIQANERNEQ